jgi:hypothetical protein
LSAQISAVDQDVSKRARKPRADATSLVEQARAIVKARSDLALRGELSAKQKLGQTASRIEVSAATDSQSPGSETLMREAHRVLLRYLPAAVLPDELCKVRAMLDAHMFGRDLRSHRDDIVRIARQIDGLAAT